jgi:hypothetical protein
MALRRLANDSAIWKDGAHLLAVKTCGQGLFSAAEIGPVANACAGGARDGRHHHGTAAMGSARHARGIAGATTQLIAFDAHRRQCDEGAVGAPLSALCWPERMDAMGLHNKTWLTGSWSPIGCLKNHSRP